MLPTLAAILQDTQPAGPPAAAPGFSWTPLILILGVVYFVLIAPERKNRKKREAMLGGLSKGDKVVTTSGMHGSVTQVHGDTVTLQVADGVRIKFSTQAVQGLVSDAPEKTEKKEAATSA